MNKVWDKSKVVYNMVTKEDDKAVARTFANVIEDVSDAQITEFGSILKTLTSDNLEKTELIAQTRYYA
ncbi:DUF1659 domain-containing protein [Apilactobacillus timberlakei]|uniref:DUF1659 domain-containing protein n=1 Tax=Apilactobacillus timberlakei TaxID=2008380 RepID=A0ABY2YS75_9LACO|nr:hypothetical protein [Apilactobacillus timberlakei]TPR13072.1 hypothetical protein DYZ97_04080 [Apilactobacillus timberlakei]TPR14123.1 hypothetical protein DY048_04035 [Apilactobacillus timberlakei]TPR16377.1 hypothetical protein DY052_02130 [Apilactobacillus timberlakei]TPR18015.1 hypothetical protein DY138_05900 [Apilactobacillus timberlakei]TPR19817.1 hypothetical protein DY061_05805 [Apilactobacillus timberlakei]